MRGIVTIAQEGRFQLVDEDGVAHHFVLSPHAGCEPQQLPPLMREQARVRVAYREAEDIIGFSACRIDVLAPDHG